MKRLVILLLIIGAVAIVQQASAFSLKDYYAMDSCDWSETDCKKAVRIMNYFMSKYPAEDAHMIDVSGATWMEITPVSILQKYALYHIGFYYGQLIPVGQEIYYCYDCDPALALKVQEQYHNQIRLYIIPA